MKAKRNLIQLCLLGALLLALPAVVQAQFTFTTNNGTITITGYTGSNGVVMIPGTIADLPVTSIGDWAFYSTSVTNVLIPDTVTNIGDGAFFDCQSLTNVIIGNSVTSIGDWTFGFCPSLMSVCCRGDGPSLGDDNVFYGNLATIYYLTGATNWGPMLEGHPTVLWNPDVPFTYTTNSDGITLTITGYTGSGGTVTIPSSINFLPVTSIGEWAFYSTFPNNVLNILIPDSVTNIGNAAFYSCTSLTNITIPSSVTSIGDYVFYGCTSLASVTLPDSVTSIGDDAFAICISLISVRIPDAVTSIGTQAFVNCAGLTSVVMPGSVTNIGDQAFIDCTSLTNVAIPGSVNSIGSEVFYNCTSLISVTISNGVTNIGDEAFRGCSSLISAAIPASVISIGYWTFRDCTSLTNITIPNGITSIGDAAFWNCTGLTSVTIPGSVTNTGNVTFEGCTGLTNVVISNGVTSIGSVTFYQCAGLTSVTIPSSVTSIGFLPFEDCTNLMAIVVDIANPSYCSIDGVLFDKDQIVLIQYPAGKGGSYTVPSTITSIGDQTFIDCTGLTNITIPSNMNSIGQEAFTDCTNLKGLFFNGNAPSYVGMWAFYNATNVTVYYLPGTTGWGTTFDGLPTALWNPQAQTGDANFGVQSNLFGFNITGTTNIPIVVEACTNLGGAWIPLQSVSLTNGCFFFSDPQWTNYPGRFYRLRSP